MQIAIMFQTADQQWTNIVVDTSIGQVRILLDALVQSISVYVSQPVNGVRNLFKIESLDALGRPRLKGPLLRVG